jgi:hypothetical protein
MDFGYLLNILLRRKWLLLSVVLFSSIATWFFIGSLPDVYKAQAVISTGIIDYKGVSLQKQHQTLDGQIVAARPASFRIE